MEFMGWLFVVRCAVLRLASPTANFACNLTFIKYAESKSVDLHKAMGQSIEQYGRSSNHDVYVGQDGIPESLVCPLINAIKAGERSNVISWEVRL